MVTRVITGAHYGLGSWLVQRFSAGVTAAYILFIGTWALMNAPVGYGAWAELFSGNVVRSFTLLALAAAFFHAWVGVRNVVMDYVKPAGVRLAIHVVVILALTLYGIWSVQILWGL